jgi:hypothetical protein
MQAQARQRVRSRRRVGMVIALVKKMLRELVGRAGLMFCVRRIRLCGVRKWPFPLAPTYATAILRQNRKLGDESGDAADEIQNCLC